MSCRKPFSVFVALVFCVLLGACKTPAQKQKLPHGPRACLPALTDRYVNFIELQQNEIEGLSFFRDFQKRNSPFLVAAIHGGFLEPETDVIARALASKEHSFYIFEALLDDGKRFHVTSTRFNDPVLMQLVEQSQTCISVHSFLSETPGVCIGGLHGLAKKAVAQSLEFFDPSLKVENPCPQFAGTHPKNFVNQCQNAGVQLEISSALCRKLAADPQYFSEFVQALRSTLKM